jgi:hypothetical protein
MKGCSDNNNIKVKNERQREKTAENHASITLRYEMTPSPWHWDTVRCYTQHEERDTKIVPFTSSEPWTTSNRVPATNLFSWLDDFCMTMMNDDIAYVGWRWSLSGTPNVSCHLYKYQFRTNYQPTNQLRAVHSYWEDKNRQLIKFCGNLTLLLCSHEPTNGLYPEPDESSSHSHILFFYDWFNKIHLRLDLTSGLFPSQVLARKSVCMFRLHVRSACPSYLHFILLTH